MHQKAPASNTMTIAIVVAIVLAIGIGVGFFVFKDRILGDDGEQSSIVPVYLESPFGLDSAPSAAPDARLS